MAEELKERKEMDPAFQWDLTTLYKDDEAWEAAFQELDGKVDAVAAFDGRLTQAGEGSPAAALLSPGEKKRESSAVTAEVCGIDPLAVAQNIRALLDAETDLDLLLSDLFAYANLRRSEDTRAPQAQKMYARIYAKYVEAVTRTAFAQPQILALPEETLQAAMESEALAPYHFVMEKLLRQKPHTLSEREEALLARFGEVFAAPGQIADNLQDADLVFDPVRDAQGQEHELTGSNFILLQTSPDRTLRENAFRSFYKGYRQHINTFASTYAGAVKAAAAEAQVRGYKPGRFSFNVKGGRCENCQGDGVIKIEMHFLPDVFVTCDTCHGKRYNREALEVKFKGKTIADVLEMTVDEAVEFFKNLPLIAGKLQTLQEVGLGYIRLGQPATTFSGGEAQRIKLATELARRSTGKTLYILDEPTTGLHSDDVKRLLSILQRLVQGGNSMIVIEHNLDVIKSADWIIDMGPEGGQGGGMVVATGTPEDVARNPKSETGKYLRDVL